MLSWITDLAGSPCCQGSSTAPQRRRSRSPMKPCWSPAGRRSSRRTSSRASIATCSPALSTPPTRSPRTQRSRHRLARPPGGLRRRLSGHDGHAAQQADAEQIPRRTRAGSAAVVCLARDQGARCRRRRPSDASGLSPVEVESRSSSSTACSLWSPPSSNIVETCVRRWFSSSRRFRDSSDRWIARDCAMMSMQYSSLSIIRPTPRIWPSRMRVRCKARFWMSSITRARLPRQAKVPTPHR